MFPIDPLLAKVLLVSYMTGQFEQSLKRVSFLSTTESLMSFNFESKKNYFEKKMNIGEFANSDFECWEKLFKFHKNIFHQKALQNISKIQNQLEEIIKKIPKSRIFFALCKDFVFIYYLKKMLQIDESSKIKLTKLILLAEFKDPLRDIIEFLKLCPEFKEIIGIPLKNQVNMSQIKKWLESKYESIMKKDGIRKFRNMFKNSFKEDDLFQDDNNYSK